MKGQVLGGRQPIAALAPEVIERIAAGEVIERPASVIRELIDNALDAGATSIRLELREGGFQLMRMADDGCGIPADELELAVAPHATSKVHSVEELERISTLGFRGEALASIAAVAELHVSSATSDDGIASTLIARPGHPYERDFVARSQGTTVTVRDLFHNVPARRAALRKPGGESARALATIRGYALAHPSVRFTAISDGAIVLQTSGISSQATIAAIYGSDVGATHLPIGPIHLDGADVTGWIAPRVFTRPDRGHVLACVNGRPVTNSALLNALEAGYRPLLRKGRHPIAMLCVRIDPSKADINIHPAKAEILLRDESAICAAIRDAVHRALGTVTPPSSLPSHQTHGVFTPLHQPTLPTSRRRRSGRLREPLPLYHTGSIWSGDRPSEGPLPEMEVLGQLDNAIIVARSQDGQLYLIDQHRAHERLLYEAICQQESPGTVAGPHPSSTADAIMESSQLGQLLLEPLLIELTPAQAQILAFRIEELATLGLVCEPFGGSTFLVRAVPAIPGMATGASEVARELAIDAAEDAGNWFDYLRISLACRTALRRGHPLSPSDQQALLSQWRHATAPAVCPHGSPIVLRYSQAFFVRAFEW